MGCLEHFIISLSITNSYKLFSFFFFDRVDRAKQHRDDLTTKLKSASDAQLSAEEKAAIMDGMLEDEEEGLKLLDQELKHLRYA